MVAKVHFLVRDDDGNLHDLHISCALESEDSLKTDNGIITPKALEGMVVDATSLQSAQDIFKRWHEMAEKIDPNPPVTRPKPTHGRKCLGFHAGKPTVCRENYDISTRINEEYRTLEVYHRNDVVAEIPVRYCPFCGQML